MASKILITGGAGFIGSHLADHLLETGCDVRALDNLVPQVHGESSGRIRPAHLNADVELFAGDIRDPEAVGRALEGVDAVVHLASAVGVGQSMYELAHYTSVNATGTAVLLEALASQSIERLVLASCLSVYGEGLYRVPGAALMEGRERPLSRLKERDWEMRDPTGLRMFPAPTPESKRPVPLSVYAASKHLQERLCAIAGAAYGIPTVILRLAKVYGTRQALSNPHTGVISVFGARYLNDEPPLLYEDGEQQRDFIHVADVVRAFRLALESPRAAGGVFNIGSGIGRTIRSVCEELGAALGKWEVKPRVTGDYRIGDSRHCYADISLARSVLGFEPRVRFETGLHLFARWLAQQRVPECTSEADEELAVRGLTI